MPSMKSSVGRVRLVGMIEGISFILLMGVGMPLKYMAGNEIMVKLTGMPHGILFLLLCWFIMQAWAEKRLSFGLSCLTFLAALIPFGPFIIDHWLKKWDVAA